MLCVALPHVRGNQISISSYVDAQHLCWVWRGAWCWMMPESPVPQYGLLAFAGAFSSVRKLDRGRLPICKIARRSRAYVCKTALMIVQCIHTYTYVYTQAVLIPDRWHCQCRKCIVYDTGKYQEPSLRVLCRNLLLNIRNCHPGMATFLRSIVLERRPIFQAGGEWCLAFLQLNTRYEIYAMWHCGMQKGHEFML